MNATARAYDLMLLITYTPRADSDARGYEDWLRRVDNPFFNAAGCIAHYSNWKLAPGPNVFAPHTHFDFLGLARPEDLDPAWNDADLNRFRAEWRRLWAVEDPAAPGAVIQTCLCTREAAARSAWSDRAAVCAVDARTPATTDCDVWSLGRNLRGPALGFDRLAVQFLDGDALPAIPGASLATCIAAPR